MKRMLDHYYERFYHKLHRRSAELQASDAQQAKAIAHWKTRVQQHWSGVEIVDAEAFDSDNRALQTGQSFHASLRLSLNGLAAEDIGVEVVFFSRVDEDTLELEVKHPLELEKEEQGTAVYRCQLDPELAGVFEYGFRAYPKSDLLAHRQDLALVKWL